MWIRKELLIEMIPVPIAIVYEISAASTEGVYITLCDQTEQYTQGDGLTAADIYRLDGVIQTESVVKYTTFDDRIVHQIYLVLALFWTTGFT